MRLIFILHIFIGQFCFALVPPIVTDQNIKATELKSDIPAGTFLRLVNDDKNKAQWYNEFKIVDQNNKALSEKVYKSSKTYTNRFFNRSVNKTINAMNAKTGKSIKIPKGTTFVISSSEKRNNWNVYKIRLPGKDNESFLVDKKILDTLINSKPFETLAKFEQNFDLNKDITPKVCTAKPVVPQNTSLDDIDRIFAQRESFLKGGKSSCFKKLRALEKKQLNNHPYGKLTVNQRADQIYKDSKEVFYEVISKSSKKNSTRGNFSTFANGNIIDKSISPELMSCIAYQETYGTLNPFSVNYTYCNKEMTSTAIGLGQMTRTTLKDLMKSPHKNSSKTGHIPYNTKYSKELKGMNYEQLHSKLYKDVNVQLLIMLRLLNSNAKYERWRNPKVSESKLLELAVERYDRDNKSKYLKNVIGKCLPCLKKSSKAAQCYQNMQ